MKDKETKTTEKPRVIISKAEFEKKKRQAWLDNTAADLKDKLEGKSF